jgi:hypothetical protein
MRYCCLCGMHRDDDAVHLCTAEVVGLLAHAPQALA